MARGKHKARSTGRRTALQEATIAQLESELDAELTALAAAEAALARVDALKVDLQSEQASLASETADYASSLASERTFLRKVYADARAHHSRVHDAWDHFADVAMDLAPGVTRVEKIESFSRVLGLNMWLAHEAKNLSTEQVTRIQRARGERRGASNTTHESMRLSRLVVLLDMGVIGPQMISSAYRDALVDNGVIEQNSEGTYSLTARADLDADQQLLFDDAIDLSNRIWNARADDLDAAAVLVWGPGGIVSVPTDIQASRVALGHVESLGVPAEHHSELRAVGLPLPSTSPAMRSHYVRQGPTKMLDAWRDVFDSRGRVAKRLDLTRHPFAPVNPHPQPGQALASQNMYARSAYSGWLNDESSAVRGQVAVGLTAAAAYWLPAGQTAAFADSEPMNDSDRREMIMPYPQTFLAFAEPLILDPASPLSTPEAAQQWNRLSTVAHDSLRDNVKVGDFITDRSFTGSGDWLSIDIDSAIEQVGAHIEGVLLLADEYGRPADLFAWCLAIPGAYGSPLGRFVIPASRATTQYRDVVDNLTAVVAWAQWHEPDGRTDVPLGISLSEVEAQISTTDFQRDAKRSGAGIRVIDVGSTNRSSKATHRPAQDAQNAAPVTPHFRRGHWRIQRFGPGLGESRRIRIAPVLVNAHRGGIAHRVYRLQPAREQLPQPLGS